MKYAIDIDGTITRYPELFKDLIHKLGLNNCVCLTGSTDTQISKDIHTVNRRLQLESVVGPLISTYIDVEVCIAPRHEDVSILKAVYCKSHAIDVLIDDCELYCKDVRQMCPSIMILHVKP